MTRVLLFLVLLSTISCQEEKHSTNTKKDTSSERSYKQVIKDSLSIELETLKADYFNGLGVAIVNETGVLYEKGIGFSDVESKRPYTTNTIQPIASVSKTFIGIALFKAVEKGLLKLDDPINKYLPFEVINPNHPDELITIRQLATHTSSIVDTENYMGRAYILKEKIDSSIIKRDNIPQSFNPSRNKITLAEFLKRYLSTEGEWYNQNAFLKNKPGDLFEYTNVGASLAAYIIEVVSNQSYATFTKEHIFEPLGMTNTAWEYDAIDFDKVSTFYSNPSSTVPHYSLITYPDGGCLTTVADLGKYLSELMKAYAGKGILLSEKSYKQLFEKQLKPENFIDRDPNHPYDDEYNTGIFMGFSGTNNIGHTGGDPGTSSLLFFNPEKGIGAILLVNTNIENQDGVDAYYGIYNKLWEVGLKLK